MRPSDVAFTDAVKAAQQERGARQKMEQLLERRPWPIDIPADLAAFIQARDSAYLGTASADGRPYIQHRGGPPGFIKVLGPRTLAFADFAGNRRYISVGNLHENERAFLFLMDYANRQRLQVWGRATIVEDDQRLLGLVRPDEYRGRIERVLVFHVETWSHNCRRHIVPRFTVEEFLARRLEPDPARRSAAKGRRGPSNTGPSSGGTP